MNVLYLTLKSEWFAKIASGEKHVEYSEATDIWMKRLVGKTFDIVQFRNGYKPASATARVEWRGMTITEVDGRPMFAIDLGDLLEVRGWP